MHSETVVVVPLNVRYDDQEWLFCRLADDLGWGDCTISKWWHRLVWTDQGLHRHAIFTSRNRVETIRACFEAGPDSADVCPRSPLESADRSPSKRSIQRACIAMYDLAELFTLCQLHQHCIASCSILLLMTLFTSRHDTTAGTRAARNNTWLLIESTPKGVVFSFRFFSDCKARRQLQCQK